MADTPDDNGGREAEQQADEEIVQLLAEQGFDPLCAAWIRLANELAAYGSGVLMGWLASGTVYDMARKQGGSGVLGLGRIPRGLRLTGDDAQDLVNEVLVAGLRRFLKTLREGQWRRDRGASLRTFFVGRCLMELPDAHDRWRRERDRWAVVSDDIEDVDDGRFSTDPAEPAVATLWLDDLLPPGEFEHVRLMFTLQHCGYTIAEIAQIFSENGVEYTESKVRGMLSKARDRARGWRERTDRER